MGERTGYAPGTFCWADLQTTDQEGAKAFYSGLFGWELEDLPIGDGMAYTMARIDGRSVAALGPMPPGPPGMPPHWNSYVAVEDADAAAARAGELGATVLAEPFDVMEAGRMAAIADPQGGAFMVWQAGENIGAGLVNGPGMLSWNELLTTDPMAAAEFYGALFGWAAESMEGAMGQPYWVIRNAGRGNGGIMAQPPELVGGPPVWTVYFGSEDAGASVQRAQDLGGRVMMPPTDVAAGRMRIAVVADPAGAVFALYQGEFED
jgi:predicted enzyme related to lactoylglutathione lyase